MISITKDEREQISAKYPDVHIVRTVKKRSALHRYYMAENWAAVKLLHKLRSSAGK